MNLIVVPVILVDSLKNDTPELSSTIGGLGSLLLHSIYSTCLLVKLDKGLAC